MAFAVAQRVADRRERQADELAVALGIALIAGLQFGAAMPTIRNGRT